MKNKKNLAIVSVVMGVVLAGVTVVGANELGIIINKTELANEDVFQDSYKYENKATTLETAKINNNVQEITTKLEANSFPTIVVQKDVPLKWTIVADDKNLNYCNNKIVIESLNIQKNIEVGENIIEFTPTGNGVVPYSCWMGMVSSEIVVVDDINNYDEVEIEAQLVQNPQVDCCLVRGN